MNNHKHDTKGHRDTERKIIADHDDQVLSNNTKDSSLNRTEQSPDDIELKGHYRRKRNELISEIRNTEIMYYSNQLEIHQKDSKNSMENIKIHNSKKPRAVPK